MGNLFFVIINSLISALGALLSGLIFLLPNSPFTWNLSGIDNSFMRVFLWIVPVQSIILSLSTFVSAVGTYYVIRVALKWIKVAGS